MKNPLPYNLLYIFLIITALSIGVYSYMANKENVVTADNKNNSVKTNVSNIPETTTKLLESKSISSVELCSSMAHTPPIAQEIIYDKEIKKDGFVKYLRIALNNYLSGKYDTVVNPTIFDKCEYTGLQNGRQCPDGAFDKEMDNYSLANIDKTYLQSKFIVLATADSPVGGESIVLLFKDKPDKVFSAWVYNYGDDGYDLRGFNEYTLSEDTPSLEDAQKENINQICDDKMGI